MRMKTIDTGLIRNFSVRVIFAHFMLLKRKLQVLPNYKLSLSRLVGTLPYPTATVLKNRSQLNRKVDSLSAQRPRTQIGGKFPIQGKPK